MDCVFVEQNFWTFWILNVIKLRFDLILDLGKNDLRFGIKIKIFLSEDLWFGTEIWLEICLSLPGVNTLKAK